MTGMISLIWWAICVSSVSAKVAVPQDSPDVERPHGHYSYILERMAQMEQSMETSNRRLENPITEIVVKTRSAESLIDTKLENLELKIDRIVRNVFETERTRAFQVMPSCSHPYDSPLEDKGSMPTCAKDGPVPIYSQALISGTTFSVNDEALNSSGTYDDRSDHGPPCSRMRLLEPGRCHSIAWAAHQQDVMWIQVDFGKRFTVESVATQGRTHPSFAQYITSYKIAYYANQGFSFYHQNGNSPTVFAGNTNSTDVVINYLRPALSSSKFRLYVVTYHNHACLRWELYGYPTVC